MNQSPTSTEVIDLSDSLEITAAPPIPPPPLSLSSSLSFDRNRIIKELLYTDCCHTRPSSSSSSSSTKDNTDVVLELSLGVWCNDVDEQFISSVTKNVKYISLSLQAGPIITQEVITLLAKYVSPKLIEITIIDCTHLTWQNHVRRILEPASFIEIVNLQKNSWVDDYVVDQLSIKFAKSLKELNFEFTKITDNALFHVGRRCMNLRSLTVNCCPQISDTGFKELSRRIHLSNINISHNVHVSDTSAEAILSTSHNLKTLCIANCPKLTDRSIAALFEKIVSWGKTRNNKTSTLTELVLNENDNFTTQIVTYIATALPNIIKLDMRDCSNINLSKAMQLMENMKCLEHLYLGPSNIKIDAEMFVEGMLFHASNLKTLHLIGMSELSDEDIGEIVEASLVLKELSVSEMDVGSGTVEALCGHVPNFESFSLAGSKNFSDGDLRVLTSICKKLRELNIQRCPLVTDEGFVRCVTLKKLSVLDASNCSKKCNGSLIASLTLCPLKTLHLDGMKFQPKKELIKMSTRTKMNMLELSFKQCMAITADDVSYMLTAFPNCINIDLTGCNQLNKVLDKLWNPHPFLKFTRTNEFFGYKIPSENRNLLNMHRAIMDQFNRHKAAKKIQKVRREYNKFIQELEKQRAIMRKLFTEKMITRVQARIRIVLARIRVRHLLNNGRLIVRGARRWLKFREHAKIRKAKEHYKTRIKRILFNMLLNYIPISLEKLSTRLDQVMPYINMKILFRSFAFIKKYDLEVRTEHYANSAAIIFEDKIIRQIMKAWKTIIGHSFQRKTKLVKSFIIATDIKTHNSLRQLNNFNMVNVYRVRRLMILAWQCFNDDFIRTRKAELLIPKAERHYDNKFFGRVVKATFGHTNGVGHLVVVPFYGGGLKYYWRSKRIKKAALIAAAKLYWRKMVLKGCVAFDIEQKRCSMLKRFYAIGLPQFGVWWTRFALRDRFKTQVNFRKHTRRVIGVINEFIYKYKTAWSWPYLIKGIISSKMMRELNAIADATKFKKYCGSAIASWKYLMEISKDLDAYYYRWYMMQLCKRILFQGFKKNKDDTKRYRKEKEEELRQKLGREDAVKKAIAGLVKAQANIRGYFTKKRFDSRKVQVFYAIQVLQNNIRKGLAILKYKKLQKRFRLDEAKRMDTERDLMYQEEKDMKYYMVLHHAALNIQRLFRGYIGRIRGSIKAREISFEKSSRFYSKMREMREGHEARLRAIQAALQVKYDAAANIQKIVRGKLARKRFIKVKQQAKKNQCTINVQTAYRKRLSMMKLQSLRRDKFMAIRYKAARNQQGIILRLLGLKKRNVQGPFISILKALGLDPLSFNYRIGEIIADMKDDVKIAMRLFFREVNLYRTYWKTPRLINVKRNESITDEKLTIQLYDAIKIIDMTHQYCGFTGLVVSIDSTVPGLPLHEIKLDFNGKVTFCSMTSDAIQFYTKAQPLGRIDRIPKLGTIDQPFVIYGVNEEDPLYKSNNIDAVWIIQRAFRQHRARKIVGRRRYEVWARSSAIESSLYKHLSETNTMTTQADNATKVMKMRSKKDVVFDEVRHKLVPPRFTSTVGKMIEAKAINLEAEEKIKSRLFYLEKCTILAQQGVIYMGYEKLTRYKKLKFLLKGLQGLFLKNNVQLKDVAGHRGANRLAKSTVQGMSVFTSSQFLNSPHVRYSKKVLYQGEWSGIPMITSLRPHGQGMLVFFDGWGYTEENKTLYLSILRGRNLLVTDMTTSDPYVDIFCNGINVQTSIKWENLNPDYYESFEIDVTNPDGTCQIIIKDKDYFGDDDFMGQITLKLADYVHGNEVTETHFLKGEEAGLDDGIDRGTLEIRVKWTSKLFDDDVKRAKLRWDNSIRIQAWARRIASKHKAIKIREEVDNLLAMVRVKAVKITTFIRMYLAMKRRIYLAKRRRATIRIQKRIRIFQARKRVRERRKLKFAAIKIQNQMRAFLARSIVKNIKIQRRKQLEKSIETIQKWIRRFLAQCVTYHMIKDIEKQKRDYAAERDEEEASVVKEPVANWIGWYGRDPEFGLKRNRRLNSIYFQRMLKLRYIRLLSKYGIVYVNNYPPKLSPEDENTLRNGGELLTKNDEYIDVFFPGFKPTLFHRPDAVKMLNTQNHTAMLHLASSVYERESVHFTVTTIQCRVRQIFAISEKKKMLRCSQAIAKFQRIFRQRNQRQQKAAMKVTSFFRMISSKKRINLIRTEKRSALIIQCSFRIYQAKYKKFDKRSVEKLSVLKCSSFAPNHGPEMVLAHRSSSFWLAESNLTAEVRIELGKPECVTEIWIQTSMNQASPQRVSFGSVLDKVTKKYDILVKDAPLPFSKGLRWFKWEIEPAIVKFFKFTFSNNYGDDNHIGVRQIRLQRSIEKTVQILKQPEHLLLTKGPVLGTSQSVLLACEADGWPKPSFQWFKNKRQIKGATQSTLPLTLKCELSKKFRTYRCAKCKMVSRRVPDNCYHIKCSNCSQQFVFREIKEYDDFIEKLHKEEEELLDYRKKLTDNMIHLESIKSKNAKAQIMIDEIMERVNETDASLQLMKEARYTSKNDLDVTNKFSDEGIYYCEVSNIRGGCIKMLKISAKIVVAVEHSISFTAQCQPIYVPRQQGVRKKWNFYSSLQGYFNKGACEGIVVIRYNDGSFYEGPYVPEIFIDMKGRVSAKLARGPNHYGVYKCADGRVFEGGEVDNHFDPLNLQSFYRLTLPNGEIYEGTFCDEYYHGVGMYTFEDGSIYEGQWHRGTRYGHGHFRSSDGWSYEGFFDTNRKHGEGVMIWPDGSCYMGDWYFDKRTGYGIYLSPLRDQYRGQFLDDLYHGHGQLIYSNGSVHFGTFVEGNRQGKGLFTVNDGNEFYGHYDNDELSGEVIVKNVIGVEEPGQDHFDVRIAIYDDGEFVKYKSKSSHPIITKQFIELFKTNREMFDSVYSMILAKNLPNLPDGVDSTNEEVKAIIFKIRNEAGSLLGLGALAQAQSRIDSLLKPIKEKNEEISFLRGAIEETRLKTIQLDKECAQLNKEFTSMFLGVTREEQKLEQYWMDEPTMAREKFHQACKKLGEFNADQYFMVKNHRLPPPMTKKLFDALSILLLWSSVWKRQQMIVSDYKFNQIYQDEDALRFQYDCKLVHMISNYNVFKYLKCMDDPDAMARLDVIFANPRFRRDTYYIQSCGDTAPFIVDWIRANYNYMKKALVIRPQLQVIEDKRLEGFRVRALYQKKMEEQETLIKQVELFKTTLSQATHDLEDLENGLAKANDMMAFISDSFRQRDANESKLDYYELLELKIEEMKEKFTLEGVCEYLIQGVEANSYNENMRKMRDAQARGVEWVGETKIAPNLYDALKMDLLMAQEKIEEEGRSLGYSFVPQENALTKAETTKKIDMCADSIIDTINEFMNEDSQVRMWRSSKGQIITIRFIYVLAWKIWKEEGVLKEDMKAIKAWEEQIPDPEEQARLAIEAKVNMFMSAVAREQGRVWAKNHPKEIGMMETTLSYQFQEDYPEETGKQALEISLQFDSGDIDAAIKAKCVSWIRLNPEAIGQARDERNYFISEEFAAKFPNETGEIAYKIINGLANEEEAQWFEWAQHWASFNSEGYAKGSNKVIDTMAQDFEIEFPNTNFAHEACRVIDNDALSRYTEDSELLTETQQQPITVNNALCWGLRNQGLLRGANEKRRQEILSKYTRMWIEISDQTENFTKGSYNLTSEPGQDRFSGFRDRLSTRFAWLHAYLLKTQDEKLKDMEDMDLRDPMFKIQHNLRPSEAANIIKREENSFYNHKANTERILGETILRLSYWNTYFGVGKEDQPAQGDDTKSVVSATS